MKRILVVVWLTALFVTVLHQRSEARTISDANGNQVLGSRPSGCPHAWCGCGLRKHLGLGDVRLNLAWMWAKMFPRTYAHPGAIAVRHHHVMQLVSHLGGSMWMVRSYNDYRRLGWIRPRDIRGFVLVDASSRSAGL